MDDNRRKSILSLSYSGREVNDVREQFTVNLEVFDATVSTQNELKTQGLKGFSNNFDVRFETRSELFTQLRSNWATIDDAYLNFVVLKARAFKFSSGIVVAVNQVSERHQKRFAVQLRFESVIQYALCYVCGAAEYLLTGIKIDMNHDPNLLCDEHKAQVYTHVQ